MFLEANASEHNSENSAGFLPTACWAASESSGVTSPSLPSIILQNFWLGCFGSNEDFLIQSQTACH